MTGGDSSYLKPGLVGVLKGFSHKNSSVRRMQVSHSDPEGRESVK